LPQQVDFSLDGIAFSERACILSTWLARDNWARGVALRVR
jgi:hypothetical protein